MKNIFIILLMFCFAFCGKYQKVLKSNDIEFKYSKALEYYNSADFNRAMPIFNELMTSFKGSSKYEELSYYFAYTHYSTGDFLTATYLFNRFLQDYPNSTHAEECRYMSAYSLYMEVPDYTLDPSNTTKAINKLQEFINKYPNSDSLINCNLLIDELRQKISDKQFANAKQYYTTENYKAAIISLNNVLMDFPEIIHREEIQFIILQSSYLLAVNSISSKKENRLIQTLSNYEQFIDNYPNSKFKDQVSDTFNKTNNSIEELKQSKNEI